MKDDLANRSFQAVLWNYFGGVGKIFAQLAIQIWLARTLGPEIFGKYTAVLVVVGFGWLLADSGFGAALIQKDKITNDDVSYAFGWVLTLSLVIGVLVILLAPQLAGFLGDASLALPILVCGPIIVLQALSNISVSLMLRDLDAKRCQIIQLSGYLVGFGVVAVSLAHFGAGVWSLVIGFMVQAMIVLLFAYAVVRHTLKPLLKGNVEFRNFGLNVLGTNLANWSIENLDRIIIGRQWGIASLGAYAAATNLSRSPTSLMVTSVQSVVFSSASRVQNDPERMRRGYTALISLTTLITFPVFVLLGLKAEFVIHLLYGARWDEAIPLFSVFCIVVPFYVLLAVTGPALWATGSVATEFKIQMFSAIVLVIGLMALADYPLKQAVWIIPCIYFFRFVLVYRALAKSIQLSHSKTFRALLGGIVLALLATLVVIISWKFIPVTLLGQHGLDLAQLLAPVAACWGALHLFPGLLIGDDLSRLLISRSADSKIARFFCRVIALKREMP